MPLYNTIGHVQSTVYRKCSMGYYTMRACLVRTLYGDSNTLVPGIRKRAAHKTKAITKVYEDRWSKGHEIAYTLHKLSSSPILGVKLEGEC